MQMDWAWRSRQSVTVQLAMTTIHPAIEVAVVMRRERITGPHEPLAELALGAGRGGAQ